MFGVRQGTGTRVPIIAGNWKMNETTVEAVTLAQQISFESDKGWEAVEVVICPPFTDLKSVLNVLVFDHSSIKLGAQDVFWEPDGAYTGAISVSMLKELECAYCIVGHSERRAYFGETDETVNKKIKALLAQGIAPIMCCGESLDVRDAGDTLAFIGEQVRLGWAGVGEEDIARSVIAYEPVWAIGTGKTATAEDAQEVCGAIRETLKEMFGEELANGIRVLYGGSAKPGNIAELVAKPDVDGALVGGASLKAADFASMVVKAGE